MLSGMAQTLQKRRSAPIGDRGVIVAVVSWVLMVLMIFVVCTRYAMKLAMRKRGRIFGCDDVLIGLAALFSIGQTAAVSLEAIHALGQHRTDLNEWELLVFQKAEYASCMLYIANMGCARIAVCLLIQKILPGSQAKLTAQIFAVLSALWTISGILATAFPCTLPNPWDFRGKRCYDAIKFINYVGITNIVMEVLLVSIPLFVWNLRLPVERRVSVSACFLSRLSIIVVVGLHLAYFNSSSLSEDYTYNSWRTVLCKEIAQNLSVITACIPCLHPFILGIVSGSKKADTFPFDCPTKSRLTNYINKARKKPVIRYESSSTRSSTTPIAETDYCRPLMTYGLDRSSAHLHSQSINRFPCNVATPIKGDKAPENVFNRTVEYPRSTSRPPTAHSNVDPLVFPAVARSKSQKSLPPIPHRLSGPKRISQVGVLPLIDFDASSSSEVAKDRKDGKGRVSPERKRTSEYVFSRAKVISVPEDDMDAMFEQEYWRKYPPPPSGEK